MDSEHALVCTVCGDPFPWHYPCHSNHEGVCHACHCLNLAGNTLERREHLAPETPLVLSPRDVQALVRYRRHVARLAEEEA